MEETFARKAEKVEAIVLDVDGVLTDGRLICSPEGDIWRNMNAKDGYALQAIIRSGIKLAIITSGSGHGVLKKLESFGVTLIYEGIWQKKDELLKFAEENSVNLDRTLFIGDDIPDYAAMSICGLSGCPADAVPEIKAMADYISPFGGGKGCVRDILEKVLRVQEKWFKPPVDQ
jgi:3-deoxy-D-manno-octulosonate 8-phosphate phosphatase (KDO 8-P phosphatase)